MKLALNNFQKEHISEDTDVGWYYACYLPDVEICLEPCMGGFDVAIYDSNKDLLGQKQCTATAQPNPADPLQLLFYQPDAKDTAAALETANELYQAYCKKAWPFSPDSGKIKVKP